MLNPTLFLFHDENTLWHYSTVTVCFGRGVTGPDVLGADPSLGTGSSHFLPVIADEVLH